MILTILFDNDPNLVDLSMIYPFHILNGSDVYLVLVFALAVPTKILKNIAAILAGYEDMLSAEEVGLF